MSAGERPYFSGAALPPETLLEEFKRELPGAVIVHNAAPPGLLLVHNFLTPEQCQRIVGECGALRGAAGRVLESEAEGGVASREVDSRKVDDLSTDRLTVNIDDLVRAAFSLYVARHFTRPIEWFEKPKILRYREGGEYYAHADAYNWQAEERRWRRVANRDFSLLIYLNEGFEGGELEFKYLNHRIAPKQGLLVAFPSDWRYAHAALPVKRGVKHTIVSFVAAKDTPRIDKAPPADLIRL
ncbi:MAG: 2OG-Fe(II) oxygenase [Amphiplicatus sp.]